jgi:transposase
MSKVTRERHSADFRARVALEAIRGEHTLAEFGARHGVHLTLVAAWKNIARMKAAGGRVAPGLPTNPATHRL